MTGWLSRRQLLGGLGWALTWSGSRVAEARVTLPEEHQRFMARAVELRKQAVARGDQAFGAVIVREGKIVGEGMSAVMTTPDPTAHGEVQAIRDAARRLRSPRLTGCELYSTFRPCPMCETAAYWAGIERIYHGESITDAGPPRHSAC
jgi:tRNA(Arg) A34 adenosine deaminase TadA